MMEFLTGMPTRHEDISRAVARLVATAAEDRLNISPTSLPSIGAPNPERGPVSPSVLI